MGLSKRARLGIAKFNRRRKLMYSISPLTLHEQALKMNEQYDYDRRGYRGPIRIPQIRLDY